MIKTKMLPVGVENFEEIITQSFYYIDKTGLIKELLHINFFIFSILNQSIPFFLQMQNHIF